MANTRRTSTKPPAKKPVATAAALAFKGLDDWIEVFTTGEHTDASGKTAAFTAEDLDQMAANVAGAGVPFVVGHPKETDRAWAWAKPGDVKREGESLLVKGSDIDPQFRESVDAGAYRERSIKVYKDGKRGWVLQHLGWLGAVPPALVLQPLQYSSGAQALPAAPDGAEVLEFAAPTTDTGWALTDVARLLRGLRDYLIGDKGLEVANQVLPDWTITQVADAGRRIADAGMETDLGSPMFNRGTAANPNPEDPTMPQPLTEAELQRIREEAAATATANLQAQFSAQGQELAELRAQRVAERIGVQINGWKAAGKLLPADEPGLAEFMAALEAGQAGEFSFSAAANVVAKQTPAQWFATFMAARKPIKLDTNQRVEGDPDPVDMQDAQAISKAASEYMRSEAAAGRTVSAAQAVQYVTTKNGA